MRAAGQQGVLGVVRCGTKPSSRVRAHAPSVQHLLRGGYKRGLHVFQGGERHHGRFGTLEEENGGGGAGEATAGEPVLATPLWGMPYADDDAGVVSQSPEKLRKMMGVIVVVCAVFGLTVLEAKTEIMCLRAKGMAESTAMFSVEAAGQVYNQRNGFGYLGGNVNHNADLSLEVDRGVRNAWCNFRRYTLELYNRPSASLELIIRMLRAEILETMLHGCVTWSPRACHYDTLRRAHRRFLTRCIGWRKHNRTDHPVSYLDTLIKTGSESIEATLRRRRCAHGGCETAEVRDVRRIGGRGGLCGGPGKIVDGVFPGRPQSFRHQRRPVDDCSPGRGGMAQNGGPRGGTFHLEMDRCVGSQDWATTCSSMPERDGKDHGDDSPKQTNSCWFARPC